MTTNTTTAELRHIDPHALALADNIRHAGLAAAVADMVDKVRDGVIVPVLAHLTDNGTVTVIDGQVRTLAAREAGLETIPVYITAPTEHTADEAEIDRIVAQYVTNEHRTDLLPSERAQAIEQLALAGLSPTKIAKKLRRTKHDVDAALAVAKSHDTLDRIDTMPELTIEQAAILAEWEHDADATNDLIEALAEGRFDYQAQYLADTIQQRRAVADIGNELDTQGITWGQHTQGRNLTGIVNATTGQAATIEEVPNEHRYARVQADEETFWTNEQGEQVDEALIDWSIEHDTDPTNQPAEGMLDPRTLTQNVHVTTETTWFVTDLNNIETLTDAWTWRAAHPNRTAGEQITAEQQAAEQEAQRQQRRRVKTLNKQAVAAREIRMTRLTEWFTRKTLPKDHRHAIAGFLTETLWRRHELLSLTRADGNTHETAQTILASTDPMQDAAEATADRAQLINLAIALAGHEATIDKDAWRGSYNRPAISTYFAFLTEVIGHTLTDVENAMTGDLDPDTITID